MTDSANFSLTTFSPSGKLVQIEYALNAVAGGATSLGIKALDGVVLATEKKLSSALIDEATVSKISLLTEQVGAVYSGMGPDARVLITKARKASEAYYRTYHESVPAAQLVRETATVMQEFTQSGCVDWTTLGRGSCHARPRRAMVAAGLAHLPLDTCRRRIVAPARRCAVRRLTRPRGLLPAAVCARSAARCWWQASTTPGRSFTR